MRRGRSSNDAMDWCRSMNSERVDDVAEVAEAGGERNAGGR